MKFILGHALLHLLSPVDASLDGLHFYLALVSAAFLGVSRQGIFSHHMFASAFWCGRHLLIWVYFSFTSCSPTPCMLGFTVLSAVSNPGSLLRSPLLSCGSFRCFNVSNVFVWGFEVDCKLYLRFPCDLALSFCPKLLYYHPLSPGFPYPLTTSSFWRCLRIFVSCLSVSKRIRNFYREYSAIASDGMVINLLVFLFSLSETKKVCTEFLSWSTTGFLLLKFSSFCEAGRVK